MEKVVIKTATKREWQGKVFVNITTEDGRGGSSTDVSFLDMIGKEVECEVKDSGKEYQNIKQYYFNMQKSGGGASKGGFAPKDWTFEKRKASLDFATRLTGVEDTPKTIERAEKFYEYLNKK